AWCVRAHLFCRAAVQCMEGDPDAWRMSVLHQRSKTLVAESGPTAGRGLPAWLDYAPGIVPPAPVVIGRIGLKNCGRRHRVVQVRVHSAEHQQSISDRNIVIENFLLGI